MSALETLRLRHPSVSVTAAPPPVLTNVSAASAPDVMYRDVEDPAVKTEAPVTNPAKQNNAWLIAAVAAAAAIAIYFLLQPSAK